MARRAPRRNLNGVGFALEFCAPALTHELAHIAL
jgi:hypothetical protein